MSDTGGSSGEKRPARAPHPRPLFEQELARTSSPADSPGAPRHFFIAAHPRSGTNWLGSLLNLHPRVLCVGEFTFHDVANAMNGFVSQPGRAASREPVKPEACRAFQTFVRTCLRSCAAMKPGATVIGDHTPRRLRVFLPDATYIALFRDGRDVVVSWTYNALARREDWVVPTAVKPQFAGLVERFHSAEGQQGTYVGGAPHHQHAAAAELLNNETWVRHSARVWAEHVVDDLDAVARIRDGRLPGRVEVVRYEDLHADATAERDRLFRALGVDPTEAASVGSEPRTAAGFVGVVGSERGREGGGGGVTRGEQPTARPEDPASHYRRGAVGDWREKLGPVAVGWVEDVAGIELATLGYGMASRPAPRGVRVAISAG